MERKTVALGADFAELELSYLEHGDPSAARTVVCVHGLTRNAHDFDVLAALLASRGCRVLAVDVAGRGHSGWLADPSQYDVPSLCRAHRPPARHRGRCRGRLGRHLDGRPDRHRAGRQRAAAHGAAGDQRCRAVRAAGGARTDPRLSRPGPDLQGPGRARGAPAPDPRRLRPAHRRAVAALGGPWRPRSRPRGCALHYDPAIQVPFAAAATQDMAIWELWDRITCPTFVLHGAQSPLLTAPILEEMTRRGPAVAGRHPGECRPRTGTDGRRTDGDHRRLARRLARCAGRCRRLPARHWPAAGRGMPDHAAGAAAEAAGRADPGARRAGGERRSPGSGRRRGGRLSRTQAMAPCRRRLAGSRSRPGDRGRRLPGRHRRAGGGRSDAGRLRLQRRQGRGVGSAGR